MLRSSRAALLAAGAILAFGLGALGSSAVGADPSLKSLRARDAELDALSRQAAYTSEVCGTRVSASIDWGSSKNWPATESLADACDGALSAVESQCRAGRRGLVTRFVCAGDNSGASLSGKTLRYGASPRGDAYAETLSVLQSH
ncbi:MAG: hypothetical protein R3C60_00570 [Parvularculaceae bacterium]